MNNTLIGSNILKNYLQLHIFKNAIFNNAYHSWEIWY